MRTQGAQVSKSMHPAAKMCTQGAGCILNFEHCVCSPSSPPPPHPNLTSTTLALPPSPFTVLTYAVSCLLAQRSCTP